MRPDRVIEFGLSKHQRRSAVKNGSDFQTSVEEEHFPIVKPDPIEAIRFRMEQAGLTRSDLNPYLQSKHKVSEVMNRKRPLSLAMIRALHAGLKIPAEILVQEPAAPYGTRSNRRPAKNAKAR